MSWIDILKKNDNDFETKLSEENTTIHEEKIQILDLNIKDLDDEFDKIYFDKIIEVKLEFKEFIEEEGFPFLNKRNNSDFTFYDFIKENSTNFYCLKELVDKENTEYLNDIEIEENENYEENKEFLDYD